jgi:hypothetical protein
MYETTQFVICRTLREEMKMAKCYNCHKEISYFSFWLGSFKNMRENFWRSKQLQISDCPHCGAKCQETPATAYTFIALVMIVALAVMKSMKSLNVQLQNETLFAISVFIFVLVAANLWWKFVSKLKEPG